MSWYKSEAMGRVSGVGGAAAGHREAPRGEPGQWGAPQGARGRGAGAVTASRRPVPWPGSIANHFQSRCEICCFKRRGGAVSGPRVPTGAQGGPGCCPPPRLAPLCLGRRLLPGCTMAFQAGI